MTPETPIPPRRRTKREDLINHTAYGETTLDYDCPFQSGRWVIEKGQFGEPDQYVIYLMIGGEEHIATPGSDRYKQAVWYDEKPDCVFYIEAAEPIPDTPADDAVPLPAPEEKLADYAWSALPAELQEVRENGETLSQLRARLLPLLNDELARLKNMEALLQGEMPKEASERRQDIERMLGILARAGEV